MRVLLLISVVVAAIAITTSVQLPVAGQDDAPVDPPVAAPDTALEHGLDEPAPAVEAPRVLEPPRKGVVSPVAVTPIADGATSPVSSEIKWPIVPSGNGSIAVFGESLGTGTAVHVVDQTTGEARPVAILQLGSFEVRTVSYNGSLVAFGEPLAEGATLYEPGPRTETNLVVYDLDRQQATHYSLEANLEPEAFSTDGSRLFVIDHRPADNPEKYRVAFLDLKTGELGEVLGPDKEPLDEDMAGVGRRQILAPGGHRLYTLYTRQDGVGEHGHQGFVHVLFLVDGYAACVDLPHGFGQGEAGTADLVLNEIGTRMAVIDSHAGQMALINTRAADPIGVAITSVVDLPDQWRDTQISLKAMDGDHFYVIVDRTGFEWSPESEPRPAG